MNNTFYTPNFTVTVGNMQYKLTDCFEYKNEIKAQGGRWNGDYKYWSLEINQDNHDWLVEHGVDEQRLLEAEPKNLITVHSADYRLVVTDDELRFYDSFGYKDALKDAGCRFEGSGKYWYLNRGQDSLNWVVDEDKIFDKLTEAEADAASIEWLRDVLADQEATTDVHSGPTAKADSPKTQDYIYMESSPNKPAERLWLDGRYVKARSTYESKWARYLKNHFFHYEAGVWSLHSGLMTSRNRYELKNWAINHDVKMTQDAADFLDRAIEPLVLPTEATQPEDIENITMFSYQRTGAQAIRQQQRVLLADEMGLGKTIQSIAGIREFPALVVTPAVGKYSFLAEVQKALPHKRSVALDAPKKKAMKTLDLATQDIVIVNYDRLGQWKDRLLETPFKTMVIDEAHYIKNEGSQRSTVTLEIAKNIPNRMALTGTPVLNRPLELYNVMRFLGKPTGGFYPFTERFCGGHNGKYGWNANGATNLDDLREILSGFMIRRTKAAVLTDLPDKMYSEIRVDLDKVHERLVDNGMADLKAWDESQERTHAEGLGRMQTLRRLSELGKVESVKLLLDEYKEAGKKVVVFLNFTEPLNMLYDVFKDIAIKIDGSVSAQKRFEAVERFQNNPDLLFAFANIQAAGVAITLTAADTAIFVGLPWNPGQLRQAEDRIHRIGQKNAVQIIRVMATMIDDVLLTMIAEKIDTINALMGGDNGTIDAMDANTLDLIVEKLFSRAKDRQPVA